jgi:hypothetical protein
MKIVELISLLTNPCSAVSHCPARGCYRMVRLELTTASLARGMNIDYGRSWTTLHFYDTCKGFN